MRARYGDEHVSSARTKPRLKANAKAAVEKRMNDFIFGCSWVANQKGGGCRDDSRWPRGCEILSYKLTPCLQVVYPDLKLLVFSRFGISVSNFIDFVSHSCLLSTTQQLNSSTSYDIAH